MPQSKTWALCLLVALAAPLLLLTACGSSDEAATTTTIESYYQTGKQDSKGRPILVPGDQGPEILRIQRIVNDAEVPGLTLEETGVYDDETLAVVLAFQYRQGLQPDGVIGPKTWDHIEEPNPINTALDPLTLVEIAKVAIDSPSDARALLDEALADAGVTTTEPTDGGSSSGGGSESGTTSTHAVVKLGEQQVYFYENGDELVKTMPCSSGRDGLTPVGTFAVTSKSEATTALGNPDTKMRWMTRFNGNIGFHGIPVTGGEPLETPLGERPVSHGCIRLADEDAKYVYDNLPVGSTVQVTH